MVKDDLLRVGINPWDNNSLFVDLAPAALVEEAVDRHEGKLSSTGALVCMTGARSGRSPKDRFIVDTPDVHDKIAWGATNVPFTLCMSCIVAVASLSSSRAWRSDTPGSFRLMWHDGPRPMMYEPSLKR